jgi:16S rRNA G966 N2-methylase RsmD
MITKINIGLVQENKDNPRTISKDKFDKLVKSIQTFPQMLQLRPIVVNEDLVALGGNMRLRACKAAGLTEVYIIKAEDLTAEQEKEFIIKDNSSFGEWDWDVLTEDWELTQLEDWGMEIGKHKKASEEEEEAKAKLTDTFVVPPFTILDTRQGYWQDRKRAWTYLINDRGETRQHLLGSENSLMASYNNGVSIFDPMLAEVICRWFLPTAEETKHIADPFAGGAFGFVATYLKHKYTGIEIREEQANINNSRIKHLNGTSQYICDDGQNIANHLGAETQDLIFSCPPYFDLEVYSDKDNDASNQATYEDFMKILRTAFTAAATTLKPNRFACIVVGDIRDERGYYRNFHEDVKAIFADAGMPLYNELILIEALGTAPQRANRLMTSRKVVKTHQNVLVFHKPIETPELTPGTSAKVLVFHKGGNPAEIKGEFAQLNMLHVDLESQ